MDGRGPRGHSVLDRPPHSEDAKRNATYEVRHKDALDWPLVTASVSLKMNGAKIASARVVLGHVATTPWVAEGAGKILAGLSLDEAAAESASMAAVESAKPLSQNGYKVKLVEVAVKRALITAAGAKKYWEV